MRCNSSVPAVPLPLNAGSRREKRGAPSRLGVPLLLATLLAAGSCQLLPFDSFTISGRLESGFGCTLLSSGGRNYELVSWHATVPPLGSFVTLRVRNSRSAASVCMAGRMVDVLRVVRVVTDFRTTPVTGSETWTPDQGPIVLGKVEVVPTATLTILPGTTVRIVGYGELRVRGTLQMVGTPAESVRITGPSADGQGGGPLVLDAAREGTRVAFASVAALSVLGPGPGLEHLSASGIMVVEGSVTIRNSVARFVSAYNATVTADSVDLGLVDGIYGEFELARSTLSGLTLSYSHASVQECRFTGARSYVLFHGQSGGTFERNSFLAEETEVVLRHLSNPSFHNNDFLSPSTQVVCESYQLTTCIGMEQNWWGTTDESQITAHFTAGCPVCYVPWLTGPSGGAAPSPFVPSRSQRAGRLSRGAPLPSSRLADPYGLRSSTSLRASASVPAAAR
jgi:hypothetical protein